ncbi:MAG TPA: DoxX family membrane protein, partial [Polyangiaceae bacterium]|nr:DoxX family membrane protein [Polyangiaceae bacterium]
MATESKKVWWQDPSLGLDVIRIYLGVGLMVRGALFIGRPEVLLDFLKKSHSWFLPLAASQYVVAAHLCGGILLALGLGTRLAAAAQIPPLLGAVLFVHLGEGLLTAGQSLEFAALVLAMLASFSVFGAGRLSLDAWIAKRNAETQGDPDEVIV